MTATAGQPKGALDPLAKLFNQYRRNTKLVVSASVISIVAFLLIALAFPFKDKILERFYPKPKSQAASCSGNSKIPVNPAGFVFTGGDLQQAISSLKSPLYYTNDLNLGPEKSIFVIGKYTQNQADPLGLRLLAENNLSNVDFKGLAGQTPAGWSVKTDQGGTAAVDTVSGSQDSFSRGVSVKLSNAQISQVFKKTVSDGQFVIFGVWVKTSQPAGVKLSVQNSQAPSQEFGVADASLAQPDSWSYITGFGKVPAGVSNFQLVLAASGGSNTAWFKSAEAAVVGPDQNQTISDLVLSRCNSGWMVDDGPGWEQTTSPIAKPLSIDLYALIYYQYYTLIKAVDPSARVLPGGLMGAPVVFDSKTGYSPQTFLDSFRTSYKNFFNSEPPIDALGIRYLAADQNRWQGADDLKNYLAKLRNYMDQVPDWKGKPIWISRLGVSKNAPNTGVDFVNAAGKFLVGNNLNVEKWFWYDTCGQGIELSPLFLSNNKICSWPMKLSALGEAYILTNITQTPTPAPTAVSTIVPTPTTAPSAAATPVSNTPAPTSISTSSATLKQGTSSGTVNP